MKNTENIRKDRSLDLEIVDFSDIEQLEESIAPIMLHARLTLTPK